MYTIMWVDLVIIMVPGLYPGEVMKTIMKMNIDVDLAVLRDNKIEFVWNKLNNKNKPNL